MKRIPFVTKILDREAKCQGYVTYSEWCRAYGWASRSEREVLERKWGGYAGRYKRERLKKGAK